MRAKLVLSYYLKLPIMEGKSRSYPEVDDTLLTGGIQLPRPVIFIDKADKLKLCLSLQQHGTFDPLQLTEKGSMGICTGFDLMQLQDIFGINVTTFSQKNLNQKGCA